MLMPEPRNMARVARGVEMNRVSSAAAGRRACSGSVIVLHTPSPITPGPESCDQTSVGNVVGHGERQRQADSLVVGGLFKGGSVALKDPLVFLRHVVTAQHASYDRVVSGCRGTQEPGLVSQLGRSGLDARQWMSGPGHDDDLVVQERLANQGVGQQTGLRPDGHVNGACGQERPRTRGCCGRSTRRRDHRPD